MFINNSFTSGTILDMHESMRRLLNFAKEATKSTTDPVIDFAGVGRRLGASAQTMTNWKRRGISKEGALQAETEFGCSAHWLLTGQEHPKELEPQPLGGQALVLDDALRSLGAEARREVLDYIKYKIERSNAPHVQEMRSRYVAALDKLDEAGNRGDRPLKSPEH